MQAVLPRLTSLHASRRQQDAERLYLAGAEVLAVLLTPVALTIAVFAHPILLLWTGEEAAANWGEVPLLWYASGSLLMAYASGPYMLQYMRGDLRLHTRFLTCMALVQTPTMIALSIYTHVVFVAAAWCLFRLMTVVAWGAYVHHRIMPGAYAPWLTALARSVGLCLAILVPAKIVLTPSLQSFATSMQVLILGLFWLCAASLTALASPTGRRWLVTVFR